MSNDARFQPLAAALLLAVMAAGCGNLPRDPKHTSERVEQQKHVRVGLVENPPWVRHGAAGPDGAEVKLIERFASSLGAAPDWFWGGEQEHMEALQHYELDLVAGGLEASSPWAKKVGLTRPYFTERIVVGVPAGAPQPERLKGLQVVVAGGAESAAYLQKNDATPIRVSDLSRVSGAAAGPEWRLRQLGLTPTRFELLTKDYVLAAPPGENGWLKRIQEFLGTQKSQVAGLLQHSGSSQ